jgi:hypothetical protein
MPTLMFPNLPKVLGLCCCPPRCAVYAGNCRAAAPAAAAAAAARRQLYHLRHARDYEELGLPMGASKIDIKKAYK